MVMKITPSDEQDIGFPIRAYYCQLFSGYILKKGEYCFGVYYCLGFFEDNGFAMRYFSQSSNKNKSLRPPDLYEYSVDNFWFKSVDLENQEINEPLKGSQKADVVIIGGGFTGLSAAFNIWKKYPDKKIVLLEGARCGYGASGRNGGFCINTNWLEGIEKADPDARKILLEIASYGLKQIKHFISDYGVECDLEESGMINVALTDKTSKELEKYHAYCERIGLETTLVQGEELRAEINSPAFKLGLLKPYGAILNPAKLVRGMKRVVEELGVEVREQTVVTRITPGKTVLVDTELGEISAPDIVIGTNAYSHKLGFFKNRVFPVGVFQIATEPLSSKQWESIGWKNRQGLSDMRALYHYSRPTVDGRIVIGGVNPQYYGNDSLSSGNDKFVTRLIEEELFALFPQLKGLKIAHAWGGTTALTLGDNPSVGVLGDHKNIYYGVGYGEGVPATQTAGRIISELMVGESNDFTNHYVVNKGIPYAGPTQLRKYFAYVAKWLMEKYDLPLYR